MMPARVKAFSDLSSMNFIAAMRSLAVLFAASRAMAIRSSNTSELDQPESWRAWPTSVGSKIEVRCPAGPMPSGSAFRIAVSLDTLVWLPPAPSSPGRLWASSLLPYCRTGISRSQALDQ